MSNNNKNRKAQSRFQKEGTKNSERNKRNDRSNRVPRGGKSDSNRAATSDITGSAINSKARVMDACSTNDIRWWNRAEHLYADATRVPFNRIVGAPFLLGLEGTQFPVVGSNKLSQPTTDSQFTAPGIMTIDYTPTIGWSNDGNSEANRAFTNLYGDIYSKTTGAMQFTQASLSMFVLSFESILANIAYAKKALAYSDLWVGRNYYYPRNLLSAMGFNPDTVIGHQDEMRVKLNSLIYNFNALKVPSFLTVFDRAYTLAKKLWSDGADAYAQLYNFRPKGYYTYQDTGNKLVWAETFATATMPFSDYLTIIDNQLNAWRNSSDLGIIGGSIQRAFADSQLLTITFVGVDDVDTPVFSPEMMDQISNMTIIGNPTEWGITMDVTENVVKNQVLFTPTVDVTDNDPSDVVNMLRLKLLKSDRGITDSDFVMEATRLIAYGEMSSPTTLQFNVLGTEWVMGVTVYTTADGSWQSYDVSQMNYVSDMSIESVARGLVALSAFKYHPDVFFLVVGSAQDWQSFAAGYTIIGPFADEIRVYTTVDIESMRGLTTAALQSVYLPPDLQAI